MKISTKTKSVIALSAFVMLMAVSSVSVKADGAYGSDTTTIPPVQVTHVVVDAGIADFGPQLITTFVAVSGLITTSFLIKRTK